MKKVVAVFMIFYHLYLILCLDYLCISLTMSSEVYRNNKVEELILLIAKFWLMTLPTCVNCCKGLQLLTTEF